MIASIVLVLLRSRVKQALFGDVVGRPASPTDASAPPEQGMYPADGMKNPQATSAAAAHGYMPPGVPRYQSAPTYQVPATSGGGVPPNTAAEPFLPASFPMHQAQQAAGYGQGPAVPLRTQATAATAPYLAPSANYHESAGSMGAADAHVSLAPVPENPPTPPVVYENPGAGAGKLAAAASVASSTRGSDLDQPAGQPSLGAITQTVTDMTQVDWTEFKRAAGDADGPLDELEVALDGMHCMQSPFYYRYNIMSSIERRVGGQGVVQFASISNTQEKAAIKFYMDRSAFERERELYTESQLRTMMPATLAIDDNASGAAATPYGYTFPPFVIIEHGQSLDEWARRNNADFITIFQSLSHAVRALARLHGFGYAHRDIKPGNILRRPNQHDWTLIDFGCTCQIGTIAALAYSMRYAAPEVIRAVEAGRKTIKVDSALDIWAIGVIAFELLTGERAFNDAGLGPEDAERAIRDAIVGRTSLPWEGPESGPHLQKLRGLKRTVLKCLERDPARRPSAEALLKSWDHTFDNMQTHGTFLTRVT